MAGWDESKHKRDSDGKFARQEEKKQELRKIYGSDFPYSKKGEVQDKKSFANIQLFAAKNYSGWDVREMKKSIRSHQRTIALHKDKIMNPEKYYPLEWSRYNDATKQQFIRKWQKEIANYQRDISRIEEELRKRGEI